MRVLLIGSDNSLGLALEQHLRRWGRHEVEAITVSGARWHSERLAKRAVRRSRPDVIVDVRIKGAVDGGERIQASDVECCHWLAKACQKSAIIYCFAGDSRVFSGLRDHPYSEADAVDNESTLGEFLQRAEGLVRDSCERHLILRLSTVFAASGVNVLTHILAQLLQGEILPLPQRRRGCPLPADDAARVMAGLLDQLATGIAPWGSYHYCSSDTASCYEFAEVVLACASQFATFGPGAGQLSIRDSESESMDWSMNCSRIRNTFAIKQIPWRGHVADAVKRYFSELEALEENR